jgi:hypothetical protein
VQCSAVQCSAVQCSGIGEAAGGGKRRSNGFCQPAIPTWLLQCSAVQCSAVQCSAVQCSAVQCSAVQGRSKEAASDLEKSCSKHLINPKLSGEANVSTIRSHSSGTGTNSLKGNIWMVVDKEECKSRFLGS